LEAVELVTLVPEVLVQIQVLEELHLLVVELVRLVVLEQILMEVLVVVEDLIVALLQVDQVIHLPLVRLKEIMVEQDNLNQEPVEVEAVVEPVLLELIFVVLQLELVEMV
tara:strand:- start:232 stop:561 length:330 start_codon:yes stop_codon:yes gene_type:complete